MFPLLPLCDLSLPLSQAVIHSESISVFNLRGYISSHLPGPVARRGEGSLAAWTDRQPDPGAEHEQHEAEVKAIRGLSVLYPEPLGLRCFIIKDLGCRESGKDFNDDDSG